MSAVCLSSEYNSVQLSSYLFIYSFNLICNLALPSRQLHAQILTTETLEKGVKYFKVNNKDTRTTPLAWCSLKKVFLKISQHSRENTCIGVFSFCNSSHSFILQRNFIYLFKSSFVRKIDKNSQFCHLFILQIQFILSILNAF